MAAQTGVRIATGPAGMRVDLMWWRAWETPLLLGFLAVFAVGSDWQEWYEVAFLAGGFATAGWLAYRTTLTVEADHDGVSFHRWHGPVHRSVARDRGGDRD